MKTVSPVLFLVLIGLGACAAPRTNQPSRDLGGLAPAVERTPDRLAPAAFAQDYSPSALFYEQHGDFHAKKDRFRPSIHASFRALPDSRISSESGSFDQGDIQGGGDVRLVMGPDTLLVLGGNYEVRRFDTNAAFLAGDETVHRINFDLGVGQHINDQTYLEGVFSPGVATDFDGSLHGDDWDFHGKGILTYEYTDEVYIKGGLHVDHVFDDVPVYPVAGLSWIFHPSWRFDVLLPVLAELSWEASTATTFTIGFELEGEEYHVRAPAGMGKARSDIITQELMIYAGLTHRFNDNLSAFGRFGGAVGGDYDLRPTGAGRVDGQLEPTFMFEVGLGWDF